jgi:hypothetical protein
MEVLKEDVHALEQEKQNLKRLWMHENRLAAGDTVSSVTTPASELVGLVVGETVSVHSTTPECFELIEAEGRNIDENEGAIRGEDDGSALSLTDTDTEWTRVMLPPVVDGDNAPVDLSQAAHDIAHPHVVFCSPVSR